MSSHASLREQTRAPSPAISTPTPLVTPTPTTVKARDVSPWKKLSRFFRKKKKKAKKEKKEKKHKSFSETEKSTISEGKPNEARKKKQKNGVPSPNTSQYLEETSKNIGSENDKDKSSKLVLPECQDAIQSHASLGEHLPPVAYIPSATPTQSTSTSTLSISDTSPPIPLAITTYTPDPSAFCSAPSTISVFTPTPSTVFTPIPSTISVFTAIPSTISAYTPTPSTVFTPIPSTISAFTPPPSTISAFSPIGSTISTFTATPSTISAFTATPPTIYAFTATPSTISAFTATPPTISTFTATPSTISAFTATPSTIYAPTPGPSTIYAPTHTPSTISVSTLSDCSASTLTRSTIYGPTLTPSTISASTPTWSNVSPYMPTTHSHAMKDMQMKAGLKKRRSMDKITNQCAVNEKVVSDFQNPDHMPDISIKIGDQMFYAHKDILSRFSEYFNTQTNSEVPMQIEVRGVNKYAFKAYLDCVYTGCLELSPDIITDLLSLSEVLGVPFIREKCLEYTGTLSVDQALAMVMRCLSPDNALWKRAFATVVENVKFINCYSHFFQLHCDILCAILSDDTIIVETELDVLRLGIMWVDFKKENRNCYMLRIVKCTRFDWMELPEIYKSAEMASSLKDDARFKKIILEATWVAFCRNENLADIFCKNVTPPRACFTKQFASRSQTNEFGDSGPRQLISRPDINKYRVGIIESILVMGNFRMYSSTGKEGEFKESTSIVHFNVEENLWRRQTSMPMSRIYFAASFMDGNVYITGGIKIKLKGEQSQAPTKDTYSYDPISKRWNKLSSMQTARKNHCLVSLNGIMYAIGGVDGKQRVLNSMEYYDLTSDRWQFVTAMPTSRFGMAAATLNDKIYVVGGQGREVEAGCGHPLLKKVEMFNQLTNSWTEMKRLPYPRSNCNLVNVNEELYLCGGMYRHHSRHDKTVVLHGIDVYNAEADRWEHIADMKIARQNAGACVIENKIYFVGGESIGNVQLKSNEGFDTKKRVCVNGVPGLPGSSRWITCFAVSNITE